MWRSICLMRLLLQLLQHCTISVNTGFRLICYLRELLHSLTDPLKVSVDLSLPRRLQRQSGLLDNLRGRFAYFAKNFDPHEMSYLLRVDVKVLVIEKVESHGVSLGHLDIMI